MRSTEACYVNKTYVEALGYTLPETLTWDFIWEVSEAATAKNADGTFALNGQDVLIPFIYKSSDNMMIQMLRQQNAGYSTDSGEILLFNDTTSSILSQVAEHVKSGAFPLSKCPAILQTFSMPASVFLLLTPLPELPGWAPCAAVRYQCRCSDKF